MSKIFNILQFIINRRKNFYKKYLPELADKYGLNWYEGNYNYAIYIDEYKLMDYDDIRSTINFIHWDFVYDEVWDSNINDFKKVKPDMSGHRIEIGKTTNKKKIESCLQETIKIYKENKMKLKALKMMKDFN